MTRTQQFNRDRTVQPAVHCVLYTPGFSSGRIAAAARSSASALLFDLEDSVPKGRKPLARELLSSWCKQPKGGGLRAVRINELRSLEYLYDLSCLLAIESHPDIVVLTMVTDAQEIEIVRHHFADGGYRPRMFVTIETTMALERIDAIAAVSDGLILGSADLAAQLGVDISWDNMLYARQRIVHAAATYGIPAVDTACFHLDDDAELIKESQKAKELGFVGKAAVHPRQVDIITKIFQPTEAEIARAREIVARAGEADGEIIRLDGNMIGPPFVIRAKKLLQSAALDRSVS
ncbi:CoA ester lyase (plasmid) [Rhizobium lusitanum]|uniref:HpcH/HpaI aldolase/citrate lyase family protein n=1 Tax=Rhizobium lusitanum TaxID=293958 RepID=UPI00160A6543|nr:CoA ester lyase [Rhizobium lusitanum]QND46580.1 CoA ester lyase [Rhizobium lusitanum]